MKRLPLALAFLFFVCALYASGYVAALEIPLTYERYPDENNQFRPYGYTLLKPTPEAPPGDWKFPAFNSKKPLYAMVDMGDSKVMCVLDATKQGVEYYDRVYFDEDANRDLTNEPPIDGAAQFNSDDQWNTEFPAVNTVTTVSGKMQPYSFRPYAYRYHAQSVDGKNRTEIFRFMLRVNCDYTGQFELEGKKFDVMIGDANVNGRFDDLVSFQEVPDSDGMVAPQGDQVYLTTQQKPNYNDAQFMANLWLLGNKLYDVAVDGAQLKLTLTPSQQKTSTVNVPSDVMRVSLRAEGANQGVLVFDSGAHLAIPAGAYRLVSYQLERTEACGDKWRLGATAQKESPSFTVAASGESELAFGEPFTPRVKAPKAPTDKADAANRDVTLAFTIEGKAKERVTDFSRVSGNKTGIAMSTKNTQLPKEPVYRIVRPDGEVVNSGSFEYG